ncbi:MAG: DUF4097 domain-containing protein [bacterium]|nr:DUF4097 domain-containing protein [bacterium]
MKKNALIIPALLAFFWLFAGQTVLAEEKVNKSASVSSDGLVFVENIAGSITIVGWDKNEVEVKGTLGDDVEGLKFKAGKSKTTIEVKYPRKIKSINEGADLIIKVPYGCKLDVECISASVDVDDLKGSLELETISGDIDVDGWSRKLEANSISGKITINGGADQIELESISGFIKAAGKEADIEVESVAGGVELKYETFLNLKAESVSGSLFIDGDLHPKGEFNCDVVSGNLEFMVPQDVDASFEVNTFSGDIKNDFGQKPRKTSKFAPGRELEFTNGKGRAQVELNSFSGNVAIRNK